MPPSAPLLSSPRHVVTAVLVAHDGAQWLPDVLGGLTAQHRPPQRVVAVDTGSVDASAALLASALGPTAVLTAPRDTGYGAAVAQGLRALHGAPVPAGFTAGAGEGLVEWVWLLHDDAAPEPAALGELLAVADDMPSAGVIGPKCRDWSGRRLVELGVTTDGAGHRHTGLDPHEVDQGQHDRIRDVLAVGTAGVLIRRDLWDRLGGLDPDLPLYGDDLDLGWRATLAGARVVVAPDAVLRHAEALRHGQRAPDAAPGPRRRVERRHAVGVVLANAPAALLPLTAGRLLLAGLLRCLVLLLTRRGGAAVDELLALAAPLAAPHRLARARARRRPLRQVPSRAVRPLLARPGTYLRSQLEQLATGLVPTARVDRRRGATPVETGPTAEEAESLDTSGSGLVRHALTRPGVLLFLALSVVTLLAARDLLAGTLAGGRLLPPPAGASDLWSAYLSSWHEVGLGSGTGAPPYLAVLAGVSTVLFGKPWLAVDVLLLGSVPIAGTLAYAAGKVLTPRVAPRLWLGAAYGLLPVLTGAIAGGRLDVTVAAMLLPLLLRGGVAVLRRDPRTAGWRQGWATGVWLAVAAAFAPLLYPLAGALLVLGGAAALVLAPPQWPGGARRRALAALPILVVPPLLLVPWTARLLTEPSLFVTGPGLVATAAAPSGHALLFAAPGGPGTPPVWLFAPVALAALVAPARAGRRVAGLLAWVVALVGLAAAVVVTRVHVHPPGSPTAVLGWAGVPTLVTAAGLLAGSVLAADGARGRLRRQAFGWRQPVAAGLAGLCAAVPAAAALAWLLRGADDPVGSAAPGIVPAFVAAELGAPQQPRLLALDQRPDGSLRYALLRDGTGPRLGDADVAPDSGVAAGHLQQAVRALAAGVGTGGADVLAGADVRFVLLRHGDPRLVTALDHAPGLSRLAAQGTPIWRVLAPTGRTVVLAPAAARSAEGGMPVDGSGVAAVRGSVPAGPGGRLLVLAEAADPGWQATLDGQALPATTAYGWAQAFRLPAGGGRLVVHHDSDRAAWLVAELVLLALALVLAAPSPAGRDAQRPPAPAQRTPARAAVGSGWVPEPESAGEPR